MTDFVSRDASQLGVDRIATTTTATALYNNLFAFSEKAPGAPVLANGYVTQAILAASSVGQGQLKIGTNTLSSGGASGWSSLSGGRYCFLPTAQCAVNNQTDRAETVADAASGGSAYTSPLFGAVTDYGGAEVTVVHYDLQQVGGAASSRINYVTSSPPYDLGDGEIPLFIFAQLSPTGDVVVVHTAEDPVWAHNGPTDIVPSGYDKDGTPFRLVRPKLTAQDRLDLSDPTKRAGILARLRDTPPVAEPITQELKNRDMALIPHPFVKPPAGNRIAMVPVSDALYELGELHDVGENVAGLVARGYIKFDATPLKRVAPPGVIPTTCSWK